MRRSHCAADSLRDEKLKVMRSLKPIAPHEVSHVTVRGQYVAGAVAGKGVEGYLADLSRDLGEDRPSTTETFVALKAEINNWRWAGVPFYLRSGKRLPQKVSEIVVQFKDIPYSVFPPDAADMQANQLVIRLQPQEGMRLKMMTKDPGPGGLRLRPAELDISFEEAFSVRYPDAYERLLMDNGARQCDAVHASRRGGGGVELGRAHSGDLGAERGKAEALCGGKLGADRVHCADRARRADMA